MKSRAQIHRQTTLRVVSQPVPDAGQEASDDEIIDAFLRGDAGSGDLLYERLIGVIENTLWRVLGARGPDHEDLVQSAFEQIVITLGNGRFAKACSLKSWAAAVTCRLALNALRSRLTERRLFSAPADTDTFASSTWCSDPERNVDAR